VKLNLSGISKMIEQVVIACTELTAMWLLQSKRVPMRKYSPIFGLLGQPFWFYSSYVSHQWGTFLLCFLFSAIWFKIFYDYWLSPEDHRKIEPEQYYALLVDATRGLKNPNEIDRLLKEALGVKK
jgi:hypothetical protein